ncbi:MAG: ABC transporter permease [Candidatus Nomurabacteria bacterium]|nr:MAG: ABC transporter permease [Candidatus Nomurabacteria bacterium]
MSSATLSRVFKFAFQNFYRNAWLSVVTIVILSLTLFMISTLVTAQALGNQAINSVLSKVDVSIFFTANTSTQQVESLADQLRNRPEVDSLEVISADDALEKFREENSDDPVIQESIEELGLNPLGPVLVLQAKDLEDYPTILEFFDTESVAPLIQDKDRDFASKQLVIERLTAIVKNLREVGFIVVAIFILIAFLVIFNTIRITIYTHREEIGIMKLVGASNNFVRVPFLIESVLYAIIATIVTALLFYPAVVSSTPAINNFFTGYDFSFLGYFQAEFWKVVLLQLGTAILLSIFSAAVAVGRYLKV